MSRYSHPFSQLAQSKWGITLSVTLCVSLLAGVGGALFYPETYRSTGTLLLLPSGFSGVALGQEEAVGAVLRRNHEGLLKSRLIAEKTFQRLKQQKVGLPVMSVDDFRQRVISAQNIKDSDFIEFSAQASTPALARQIAQAYLDSYLAFVSEIMDTAFLHQKEVLLTHVAEVEQAVATADGTLRTYQERYGVVDLPEENREKIRQLAVLEASIKTIEADLAGKKVESAELHRQLRLKQNGLDTAIQAVALGQDAELDALQRDLYEADKEYQSKLLVLGENNPELQRLQEKVDTLKRQIADRNLVNVGETLVTPPQRIKDPVRIALVSRLAAIESDIPALKSKLAATKRQAQNMRKTLQALPKRQLEYARLLLERQSQENILRRLQEELSDLQILKDSAWQTAHVIDPPNLPAAPVFPTRLHLVLLAAAAGFGLSAACVQARKDPSAFPEPIGRRLKPLKNPPVLSVLPWLPKSTWQTFRDEKKLEMTMPDVAPKLANAYRELASNLKHLGEASGKKALVAASVLQNDGKSWILGNLAFCLAQSGDRVILVDANLRKPHLHEVFNHNLNYEKSLPELINSLSEALSRREQVQVHDLLPIIEHAAIPSAFHPNLHFVNAGLSLNDTFEFLNCKGFGALIETLKASYDWVLVDAPPFLEAPDAAVLLSYTDALLLMVENGYDETQIRSIQHRVERLGSSLVGVVTRSDE